MLGLLLSGSGIMIVYKFQNETTVYVSEEEKTRKWKHPFYSALVTAVGQTCTVVLYFIKKALAKNKNPF